MKFSKFLNTINRNYEQIIQNSIAVQDINLELDLAAIPFSISYFFALPNLFLSNPPNLLYKFSRFQIHVFSE